MTALDVKLRTDLGTKNTCDLRESGLIPGIIYGGSADNVCVSIDAKQLKLAVAKGLSKFELQGEVTENVTLKDVQYDGLGTEVLHVDLIRA